MVSNNGLDWRSTRNGAGEPHDASLAALPFPAAIIDAQGTIRQTNELWVAAPEATIAGQSYEQFCQRLVSLRPDSGLALTAGIRAVLSGRQKRFTLDYPVGADGETRFYRCTVSGYHGAQYDGALILCEELEIPSREDAVSDDEHRRQAEKMESVGRLVGGVAHDFANLVTLIAGYTDILLNRISHLDPLRPEVDEIRQAANRGARLTSQLLGFCRGQSPEPRFLDLNAIVSDMQRMLRPIIGEYVDMKTVLGPGLGRVFADPGQMEQVIVNLVLNARDAMPAGGTITIETANREITAEEAEKHGMEPGPGVLLSISDTGQGMDSETMGHLFQPFFTTKERGKGTGLGLSTVYGIIKQHHGDVWAHSLLGHGTTFTIWLPQAAAAQQPADVAVPARPVSMPGDETILLVEDEENVRRLLRHVLAKRGYQVLEASHAEEALAIFNSEGNSIDLLLTDMVMPRMSGRELAERIQSVRPGIPVIYMSGYTDDVLVRTGALSPGMSFLQKPLRPEVLTSKVREALDAPAQKNAASR
jgi:two-component system cell cycle sensor histidine kinase/response regulator CckA